MDPDEMEEDQEAVEIMKSSQFSNINKNQQVNPKSINNSPQPRRNIQAQQQQREREVKQHRFGQNSAASSS